MRMAARTICIAMLSMTACPAVAQKCFNEDGTGALPIPDCLEFSYGEMRDGKPFLYDGKGKPLLIAFTEGKKANKRTLFGARDTTGRIVVPAKFAHIKALSPWLAVGTTAEKNYEVRIFLIDLRSGAMRATPYIKVMTSFSARWPSLHLAQFPGQERNVALLDVAGNETGVQILGAGLGDDATTRSLAFEKGMKTISPGAIQLGRVAITIEGKEPAGGRPLFDDGYSVVFADTGRTVPGVTGEGAKGAPASNTLFLPLDSVGQMQVPPNGVLGVVRTRQGWYYARQAAGGGVLYQYIGVGTLPDLAAKPVGQQYSALHSYGIVDIGRTPKGWGRAAGSSLGTTYPDMTIAAAKIDAEVREKLRVDTAVLVARNKAQEEARLAEERLEQGLRRNDLLAQLDRASREKWPEGSLGLKFLQDRIVNYGLEEEYRRAGLPMSRVEDEACRRGRSSYCSAAINRSASSGSSFEWTWQKSFDDASAASKRRNTENCAAALKGAARMCTMP